MHRPSPFALLIPAALAACSHDSPTGTSPERRASFFPPPPGAVVIFPGVAVLRTDQMQEFEVFVQNSDGTFSPVTADWNAASEIGTVSPANGSMTTLTAPAAIDGDVALGLVQAMVADGVSGFADVAILDGSDEIGDHKYKAGVQLSSGPKLLGAPEYPNARATFVKAGFPEHSTGQTATFDNSSVAAPAGVSRIQIVIDGTTGKILAAAWGFFGTNMTQEISEAKGKKKAVVKVPDGTVITEVLWGGENVRGGAINAPRDKDGNPIVITDVHITSKRLTMEEQKTL